MKPLKKSLHIAFDVHDVFIATCKLKVNRFDENSAKKSRFLLNFLFFLQKYAISKEKGPGYVENQPILGVKAGFFTVNSCFSPQKRVKSRKQGKKNVKKTRNKTTKNRMSTKTSQKKPLD